MTPTKEQIEEAANLICGAETFEGVGFKVGARWALEQVAPRWIPVEERLPIIAGQLYGDYCLVNCQAGILEGFYDAEDQFFRGRNMICIVGVTHWQPLPTPPTE